MQPLTCDQADLLKQVKDLFSGSFVGGVLRRDPSSLMDACMLLGACRNEGRSIVTWYCESMLFLLCVCDLILEIVQLADYKSIFRAGSEVQSVHLLAVGRWTGGCITALCVDKATLESV